LRGQLTTWTNRYFLTPKVLFTVDIAPHPYSLLYYWWVVALVWLAKAYSIRISSPLCGKKALFELTFVHCNCRQETLFPHYICIIRSQCLYLISVNGWLVSRGFPKIMNGICTTAMAKTVIFSACSGAFFSGLKCPLNPGVGSTT
jgi:hypothetical protein